MSVTQHHDPNLRVRSVSTTIRPDRPVPASGTRDIVWSDNDELFRGIYTRAGLGFAPEILAVTSALPGEGKTTLSLALAISFAQDFPDRNVLLVETDVAQPALAADFDFDPIPGLVNVLIDDEPVELATRPTFLPNLDVMPAGLPLGRGGRPLRSARMPALLDSLRQTYHLIILDTPTILTNSDTLLLTDFADGVLVVVRCGVTSAAQINKALDQVDDTKLRGLVLNGADSATPRWLRRLMGN